MEVLKETLGDFDQQAIRVVARMDLAALNADGAVLLDGVTPLRAWPSSRRDLSRLARALYVDVTFAGGTVPSHAALEVSVAPVGAAPAWRPARSSTRPRASVGARSRG